MTDNGPVVIGYVRTSTDRQELSPEAQREAIQRKCEYEGWQALWFRDVCSGTTSMRKRECGALALDLLRTGVAEKLVVAKLDRLSRKTSHLAEVIERARTEEWGIVMLDFDGVDTSTPTGKLVASILVTVAEFENERRSERQREAVAVKMRTGWVPGPAPHAHPPRVVRRIVADHKRGLSLADIAESLNEDGVRTASGEAGTQWHASTVSRVLRRAGLDTSR